MESMESFADFVKRWRSKAAQRKDRPSDKDQIRLIVRNLQPTLAKHMVMAHACSDFKIFFDTGLTVEEAIQLGILDKPEPLPPKAKKVYPGNSNTLFGNAQYTNLPPTSANTTQVEPVNQIVTQNNQPRSQPRVFSQLSASLSAVLEKLVETNVLKPLNPTSLPQKLPTSHNPNAYCAYHQNVGHSTKNCFRLRHAIQDLIDNKTIPVPPQKPNTVSNPLPKHSNPQANCIELKSPFDPSQFIIPEKPAKTSHRGANGRHCVCYTDPGLGV